MFTSKAARDKKTHNFLGLPFNKTQDYPPKIHSLERHLEALVNSIFFVTKLKLMNLFAIFLFVSNNIIDYKYLCH